MHTRQPGRKYITEPEINLFEYRASRDEACCLEKRDDNVGAAMGKLKKSDMQGTLYELLLECLKLKTSCSMGIPQWVVSLFLAQCFSRLYTSSSSTIKVIRKTSQVEPLKRLIPHVLCV